MEENPYRSPESLEDIPPHGRSRLPGLLISVFGGVATVLIVAWAMHIGSPRLALMFAFFGIAILYKGVMEILGHGSSA